MRQLPLTARWSLVTGHWSRVTGHWSLVTALLVCITPLAASAQADSIRSTRTGVYTEAQSERGQEIYALHCMSCHSPASHAGPEFAGKWRGRLFWDLFQYVRESMPKSEPGSLTAREYLLVLAYLLKMNGMPQGPQELPTDSSAMSRIRIDFKPARDSSQKR